MIHNLLDAPCVFCGHCAAKYYQSNTHKPDCPWRSVGGLKEREEQVRAAIRGVIAERDKLKAALEACDVVMDTAAIHRLPQQLPPTYRDSWAWAHTNAREALKPKENGEGEREFCDHDPKCYRAIGHGGECWRLDVKVEQEGGGE